MAGKEEKENSEGGQKGTEYQPTLSEEKLLEVLLNPEHRLKSVTDICSIACVDRKIYYRAYKKPEFVEYVMKESRSLVKEAIPAIILASARQAKRGDAAHTKIMLGMAGLYNEKVDHSIKQDVVLRMVREYDKKPPKSEDE